MPRPFAQDLKIRLNYGTIVYSWEFNLSEPHDKRRERSSKLTLFTIFFVIWLFLALSFLSYTPQDLPTKFVYHDVQEICNLAGLPGAWCAYIISSFFGVAGYYLVLGSLFGLACFLLVDRIREPYNKIFGFFLTLVATSGFSAFFFSNSYGPPIGPGGMTGAVVKFFFDKIFNVFGSYLALSVVFLSGLTLILPECVLRVVFWSSGLGSVVGRVFRPFLERIQKANPQRTITSAYRSSASLTRPYREGVMRRPITSSLTPVVVSSSQRMGGIPATSVSPRTSTSQSGSGVCEIYMNADTPGALLSAETHPNLPPTPNIPPSVPSSVCGRSASDEYVYPSIDLLDEGDYYDVDEFAEQIRKRGEELERVCRGYKVELKVVDVQTGPVLTLYEVELQKGLRVKALHNLSSDLEIAMKAPHVRIVSPIPGKNTVGVELPNRRRQLVRLREVMESCAVEAQSMSIPIFLGKDVVGAPMVADLAKLPHLLIAGRTGTGKSVCLNSIIMSIIMTKSPQEVRLIMIDPKMVELSPYKSIPHLMHPVVVDMQKAEAILEWAVEKMEERYRLFARVGVRKITEFNKLTTEMLRRRLRPVDEDEWNSFPKSMPSIVIVADEMADLIMTSGKDVERHIVRLAQKSRAVGIHLVLATQKPTVDVVTGLIKSNLPARIAFGVASRVDSQVVLDVKGAEQLLGNGDMLFLLPGTSQLVRGQGAFVSDREIDSVIEAISVDKPDYEIEIPDHSDDGKESDDVMDIGYDEFYIPAVDTVIEAGRASTSMLQRKFSIGYTRAARIIDMMTQEGIVSDFNPAKPSRPRDVLITMEEWRGKQHDPPRNSHDANSLIGHDVDENVNSLENRAPTSIPAVKPAVVLSNGQELRPQARQYEELAPDETDLLEEKRNNPEETPRENKDKGWSDEQWNQYINFDSDLD